MKSNKQNINFGVKPGPERQGQDMINKIGGDQVKEEDDCECVPQVRLVVLSSKYRRAQVDRDLRWL